MGHPVLKRSRHIQTMFAPVLADAHLAQVIVIFECLDVRAVLEENLIRVLSFPIYIYSIIIN